MSFDLAFTPSGRVVVAAPAAEDAGDAAVASRPGRVVRAFASCQAAGLFALAVEKFDSPLSPSAAYWRDFAAKYLTELCHTPETADARIDPIPPPTPAELAALELCLPPMQGAEYVTDAALRNVWADFDCWVRDEVVAFGQGLSGFLMERAPLWRQVGRVCFHLAENRRDPEYPFAFLATYAPSLSAGARVQYQPLSKALRQYAGAKDKQTLIKLLSPVHLASQTSALVKELVDSGDIYQPLAWTPRQAYRFLKEVPVFEESGVLVRLPDWWKKRPRPRVSVTIGSVQKSKFDASAMLDFQVRPALGDETLTDAEWRELLAAEDGLVLLRGQWVEVDRDRLAEVWSTGSKSRRRPRTGFRSSKGCGSWPARPGTSTATASRTPCNATGRCSARATGSARCWRICERPKTSIGPNRAPN